jgi:hypothetical protein
MKNQWLAGRWNKKLKLRLYRGLPDPSVDNSPPGPFCVLAGTVTETEIAHAEFTDQPAVTNRSFGKIPKPANPIVHAARPE